MTKVSIITSTYNRCNRLAKAIESVQKQTFQDYEHIIVDDGSTDGTAEIVKGFNDPKIKYIKRPKNFGTDTRPKNDGILKAQGEYIAFLDDDCEYRPDHLQALVSELDKQPENIPLVYGDRWLVDETKSIGDQLGITSDFNAALLMQRNYIDMSDVLVRKQALYDVGGFDEEYRKYVDWNLWVRLNKYGYDFKHVPLILTDYHLHSGMKSNRPEDEKGFSQPAWDPYDCIVELNYLGIKPEPRVAIFTLTYDRLEYTKACFEALHKTARYKFDHYVVDNGSTDGTIAYMDNVQLKTGSPVWFHSNMSNIGISAASNQAVQKILKNGYDIIIKVDNDCHFENTGWLEAMVKVWKSNHRLALSCYVQGLKDNPGGAPRFTRGKIAGETIGMTKHLGGICHFVDARAYKNWRWDESSFLHGMQDLEFSQYLLSIGYQMGYLENWFCTHIDGTEGQHKKYPEYFERRKQEKQTRLKPVKDINTIEHWDEVYSEELMGDPNYRNDMLSWAKLVSVLEDKPAKLLDAGCGSGYLLNYLEKKLPKLELYGIDLSPEGIEIAKKRSKANLTAGDLKSLPYENETFDYLVSTEVLEHIVDIEKVLAEYARVIKKGGFTAHLMPYKDYIPSDEHVREYDEESITKYFESYFTDIKTEVIDHNLFIKVWADGTSTPCKLLYVQGVKK